MQWDTDCMLWPWFYLPTKIYIISNFQTHTQVVWWLIRAWFQNTNEFVFLWFAFVHLVESAGTPYTLLFAPCQVQISKRWTFLGAFKTINSQHWSIKTNIFRSKFKLKYTHLFQYKVKYYSTLLWAFTYPITSLLETYTHIHTHKRTVSLHLLSQVWGAHNFTALLQGSRHHHRLLALL